MDASINFFFRNRLCHCDVFVDKAEFPCYVFTILRDKDLISEFGNDVTLKTDFETSLSRSDDTPSLLALRNAIYYALKETALFLQTKAVWKNGDKSPQSLYGNIIAAS
jgi:hypothetical protein